MSSTSAGATTIKGFDDLFVVDVTADSEHLPIRAERIVTGLSDEEDAQALIARRFDPDLRFCPNCEIYLNSHLTGFFCPTCHDTLQMPGTPARRRKHFR